MPRLMIRCGARPEISAPSNFIEPEVGGNVPESMLKSVLLPEPLGPIRPRISPRSTLNVSFKVERGEILGLIGPNGSGKSTIFNMLSGTFPPTSGSIKFDGAEISGLAPHRIINRGIGRTFQIPRPFHRLTMFENVALAGYFGQGRHSRAKATDAAERALAMVGLQTDRGASVEGL